MSYAFLPKSDFTFLRLEEEYWCIEEESFFINFIGVSFEAGNETREKTWIDFATEKNEEWSEKRVVFCLYHCFLESEKLRCEKNSASERNFVFTCGILKQFFSLFLVTRFGYDFILFLGWF